MATLHFKFKPPCAGSNYEKKHKINTMKKTLNIILLATCFLVLQACSNNEKKNSENESALTETPVGTEATISLSERRAKLESQRVAREQKRADDLDALLKLGPYYTDKNGKIVYYKAEVNPSFTGGQKALDAYLNDNLVYPQEAEELGLEGTVFVDFIVLADGSVNEVEVLNDPSDDIDQRFKDEAVRVVSSMPDWAPGQQRGKAVDVKFSLPITFQIK
jgi:TonB family protein